MKRAHVHAVTWGAAALPTSEAILADKAAWTTLLGARDSSKAAPPEHRGLWIGWDGGRLYAGDGTHLLRVQLGTVPSEVLDAQPYETAGLEAAIKALTKGQIAGVVRTRDGKLYPVVGELGETGFAGRVVEVRAGGEGVLAPIPAAPDERSLAQLFPPAAVALATGEAITGFGFRAPSVILAGKVAKLLKSVDVRVTTPPASIYPHRWDFPAETKHSDGAEWTLVCMSARTP